MYIVSVAVWLCGDHTKLRPHNLKYRKLGILLVWLFLVWLC